MKTRTSPALIVRMKDDPWFTPDTQLDTSGLSPDFRPQIVEEPDPFTPAPEPRFLTAAEREKLAARDPELVTEAITELAKAGKWTSQDVQSVLLKFHPAPQRTFFVGCWNCSAEFVRGTWQVKAHNEETGEQEQFKTPGIDREDTDSLIEASISRLTALDRNRKPYRELNPGELDSVARIASAGDIGSMFRAGEMYLGYALDRFADDDSFNLADCQGDTRFTPLWTECAWYVFLQGRPDIDAEAQQFMEQALQDRVITLNSLWNAYELWQSEKQKRSRGLLFSGSNVAEPESAPDLDTLSDAQIADTLRETRKFIAGRGKR